jgi:UDP-N-acetylglucosamine 3-dehydrogenase
MLVSVPSRRRPRRVAVLGVGAMGRRHVRVLAEMPDRYELVGVLDADRRVAEVVAAERKIPVFCDVHSCVEAAELVVIASPIEAHASGAGCALDLRRHVLVEKPLCASVGDAFALVRAAARRSARLFVGHSERFNPVVVALRRLVRPADVRAISIRRAGPAPLPTRGALFGSAPEDDVLLSLGVHDVDLASYLLGASVTLRSVSGVAGCGDANRAELTLTAANGVITRIVADRTAVRRERTIELTTRSEVFEGDLLVPFLRRRPRAGGALDAVELSPIEPLAAQAYAVAVALDGDRSPGVATGAEGARALALVVEARRRMQLDWPHERRVSAAS